MQFYDIPWGAACPPRTFLRARAGPPPPLPLHRAGRVNQSCLTADIWFHSGCGNTIPHRSKSQHTAIGESVVPKVVSRVVHGTRGTEGGGIEGCIEGGIEGGTWYGWYRRWYRGWYMVPLHARHIEKY